GRCRDADTAAGLEDARAFAQAALPFGVREVLEHVFREDQVESCVADRKRRARVEVRDLAAALDVVDVRVEPACEHVASSSELQLAHLVIPEVCVDELAPASSPG